MMLQKKNSAHTYTALFLQGNNFFTAAGWYTLLLCLLLPAGMLAQVSTVVRLPASPPSFKVVPRPSDTLLVSANGSTAYNKSYLQFDLSGIPAGSSIASATLRLTLAADPSQRTSVLVHQVTNNNMEAPQLSPQIAARTIRAEDYPRNSVVLFDNFAVDRLQQALAGKKFTIQLSTTYNDGSAAFYSSALTTFPVYGQDPAYIPRLVVAYTPEPAPLPWPAYHADAQHTALSPAIFAGSKPARHSAKEIRQFNNNILRNMVLYRDKAYIMAQDASAYHLYAIDPVTKAISQAASNLPVPEEMAVIDPYGRYYYPAANKIGVINLEAGNTITYPITIAANTLLKAPPTTGQDGTLYLAAWPYIYAYAPYPRHDLLWQYVSISQNMSSVTLNNDGSTAYVVFGGDSLNVVAINTVSGEGRRQLLDKTPGAGRSGRMVPVINNQDQLFVTDNFPQGKALYVLNTSLKPDTIIRGNTISQPAMGGDGTVYYVQNGNLMAYRNKTVRDFVRNVGDVSSLITDAGNNVYCWNTANRVMGYNSNGEQFLDMTNPLEGLSREWEMTLAIDGSLYTGTSRKLYSIRPVAFSPSTYSLTRDDLGYNNRTYRADTIRVAAGLNFEKGYTTTLTGSRSVVLGDALLKGSAIHVVSGGSIGFAPGFRVETGAVLSCKTGY
ncbi:MAG: DNRLRE domain-containing protein [Chitinophagaceae bacterium]